MIGPKKKKALLDKGNRLAPIDETQLKAKSKLLDSD